MINTADFHIFRIQKFFYAWQNLPLKIYFYDNQEEFSRKFMNFLIGNAFFLVTMLRIYIFDPFQASLGIGKYFNIHSINYCLSMHFLEKF